MEVGDLEPSLPCSEYASAVWGPGGKRSNNDRPHSGTICVHFLFCIVKQDQSARKETMIALG